tara:strand:+ start:36611 stop:38683 length:2073 start_codon:yes stop_codon:yes gene_type:complete
MRKANVAKPKFDYLRFAGGYDTETKPWNAKGGKLRESQNYEMAINNQGYKDIQGYEIFDGQTPPSEASYAILDVNITGSFSVSDTITQLVSGATGVVIAIVTSETPNYLVLARRTGTFNDSDDLQVSAVTEGNALSTARQSGATTSLLNAQYLNLAADELRTDLTAVPGSNGILGIYMLNDIWYAFRNNAGGTEADLYKSTVAGWVQVPLGRELAYTSGGTYDLAEGDVITGATSGATATITRVMLESGSILGGDSAGKLIFASQTGTFQAENLDVGGNLNIATIAGDSSAITLLPDGRFEMVRENFGGTAGTQRIYGADTVNRGFEFDGTVFCPIDTGMVDDSPSHVVVHKNHLFFSFAGSAQHSGIGTPYIFNPIFGAAELATGDDITGFMSEPGTNVGATLGIYNRNTTHMLYGTSVLDWNLVKFRDELGAFPYSIQQFGQTMYLDDRGLTTFKTVQDHGNFQQATVSRHVQSFINTKRTIVSASCIARDKNQYRLFFSDKTGIYVTTEGQKVVGIMPILFSNNATCAESLEDSTGVEVMMIGSSNGKVYQLDRGTSFDGEPIEAYLKTFFNFSKSIRYLKKYLGVTLEATGEGYAEFNFSTELGYNSTDISQPSTQNQVVPLGTVFWDTFVWDSFVWDGASLAPTSAKLEGSAENISIVIRKNSDYFFPMNLTGAMIRFIPRRQLR